MYKTFRTMIHIFWLLDICNMPFMEIFDTLYPINGLMWLLIFLTIPSIYNEEPKK